MRIRIKNILRIGSLLGITAIVAGLLWYDLGNRPLSTDNAYVRSDITTISSEVSGTVRRLYVEDNQPVHKGDLLLEIDAADYQARLEQARSQVQQAKAALLNLQSRIRLQRNQIDESQAGLQTAEVEKRRAEREQKRITQLRQKGLASIRQADDAQASAQAAEATVRQQQAQLAASRQQAKVLSSEQPLLQAKLDQARAGEQLARNALNDTQLRAPVSGVVGNRHIQIGNFTRAGTALLSIVPLENVWIEANFKETQLAGIAVGQPVEVRLDSYPDQPFRGVIVSISPASGAEFSLLPPDNATGNFVKVVQRVPVKIRLEPPQELMQRIRPGMSAEVSIDLSSAGKTESLDG